MFVTLSVMPIYAWLKWRQFFGGDPRHDIVYRANFMVAKKFKLDEKRLFNQKQVN